MQNFTSIRSRYSSVLYIYIWRKSFSLEHVFYVRLTAREQRSISAFRSPIQLNRDRRGQGWRQREGHFPGLCTGGSNGLSRGWNIIHDRSYEMNCNCRYYLQGTGIEFYTLGIPFLPPQEAEYFIMINHLCRQHAPFFSPPLSSSIFLHYVRDT